MQTQQLARLHDALQERGYKHVLTFEWKVTPVGKGGRIEDWKGPKGDRMVQVTEEHGVVVGVEVFTPLTKSTSLAETIGAL